MADQSRRSINLTNSPHDKIQNSSSCSGFPSEAMLWIKEVEMVESVNDFESSRSIQGYIYIPNFGGLRSALNKIIQNSYFKDKVSLEEQKAQKEDRFLRGRQIAYMIYLQVSGARELCRSIYSRSSQRVKFG